MVQRPRAGMVAVTPNLRAAAVRRYPPVTNGAPGGIGATVAGRPLSPAAAPPPLLAHGSRYPRPGAPVQA